MTERRRREEGTWRVIEDSGYFSVRALVLQGGFKQHMSTREQLVRVASWGRGMSRVIDLLFIRPKWPLRRGWNHAQEQCEILTFTYPTQLTLIFTRFNDLRILKYGLKYRHDMTKFKVHANVSTWDDEFQMWQVDFAILFIPGWDWL